MVENMVVICIMPVYFQLIVQFSILDLTRSYSGIGLLTSPPPHISLDEIRGVDNIPIESFHFT